MRTRTRTRTFGLARDGRLLAVELGGVRGQQSGVGDERLGLSRVCLCVHVCVNVCVDVFVCGSRLHVCMCVCVHATCVAYTLCATIDVARGLRSTEMPRV